MKRNSVNNVIKLDDAQKNAIIKEIEAFGTDVRGEEMGIIEREQIYDLFMENLAPIIYNKALDDAIWWYKRQQENIESDYYAMYKSI